jgi:hypothetical protein
VQFVYVGDVVRCGIYEVLGFPLDPRSLVSCLHLVGIFNILAYSLVHAASHSTLSLNPLIWMLGTFSGCAFGGFCGVCLTLTPSGNSRLFAPPSEFGSSDGFLSRRFHFAVIHVSLIKSLSLDFQASANPVRVSFTRRSKCKSIFVDIRNHALSPALSLGNRLPGIWIDAAPWFQPMTSHFGIGMGHGIIERYCLQRRKKSLVAWRWFVVLVGYDHFFTFEPADD